MDVSSVIQRQLDAYNGHDLELLVSLYSEDAELFEYPCTLLARGRKAIKDRFHQRFSEPNLQARLLSRSVMGSIVVDHERVNRMFSDGTGERELIMIYEVLDNRIRRAWSIPAVRSTPTTS